MNIQLVHLNRFISFIYDVTQIDSPVVFIERADHCIILLLQHNRIGNILVIPKQTGPSLKILVPDAAAAYINLSPQRVMPQVLHLRSLIGADTLDSVLNHGIIIRIDALIPPAVTLLRRRLPGKAKQLQHGFVRIHSRFLSLFQFDCPQTGLGLVQNILNLLYILKMFRHLSFPPVSKSTPAILPYPVPWTSLILYFILSNSAFYYNQFTHTNVRKKVE